MRFPPPILFGVALAACVAERGPLINRMAQSGTSYLARAARQPVGWQPWGRDAFALAARLDRPILLYVGADECRWCAVMDREVYGDAALGALIDSLFVPVRVDRAERPDVARRYQAAVQSLAGLRGPPLTVFLTPDGGAFFGGTYFPADDPVTGRGLRQILPQVARSYREQRDFVERHAALVRQLAGAKSALANGVLRTETIHAEIGTVHAALQVAAGSATALGSFPHALAVGLVLAEFGRTGDTTLLDAGTAVLDYLLDSLDAPPAPGARDDPHDLVRAGLLRDAALAWALTASSRYRDAARRLGGVLAARGARGARAGATAVFADREGYVLASLLEGGVAVGDTVTVRGARAALDALLRRVYAPGRGVRHGGAAADVDGLLQDHVQIAGACVAAYEAFGEPRYLAVAEDLAAVLDRDFADPLGGYFDTARSDAVLPHPSRLPAAAPALADRTKEILDDLLPGANAWAARTLLRLADATGDDHYRRRAEAALEAFAEAVGGEGVRASSYLGVAREALARR